MEDLTIIHVIAGIAIFLTIFLLLRELVCWYFKINERMKIQKETNNLLKKILNEKDFPQKTTEKGTDTV